ncbi:MAG: hypothetical protein ACC682_01760 [Gemmatimonadota bacterium]
MATRRNERIALSILLAFLAGASGLRAQDPEEEGRGSAERVVPTNFFVISGYGTVGYFTRTQGERINAFTASFAPVFLFQFQDRILFEAELEFEIEDGVTQTGLEYASLDYVASDNITLVAGKFLVPFGVFGERIHPSWINKFPSSPPIYGHESTGFGASPLMPVLADVGVMGRATMTPGPWQVSVNGYVTQGPALEVHDEEEEGDPDGDGFEAPGFGFPASSSDNNVGKMPGMRLDIALPPWFEVNGSFFNGDYDEQGVLDVTGWNLAAEFRHRRFEVRGEYMQIRQEVEQFAGFQTLRRSGFYTQASYRTGRWEPVLRWTQIFDDQLEGAVTNRGAWQAGFALDYWVAPSVAVMAGYELNRESGIELDNDRLIVHLAFGY